jgi:iron transport multicopper oxidase
MRRDTFQVWEGGYIVLRFKADNPDMSPFLSPNLKLTFSARIQLFHCHIEWHVEAGLIATFIEAPDVLQDTESIPHDHYQTCESQGIPTKGNAAGNTHDWLDLTGANTAFNPDPWG